MQATESPIFTKVNYINIIRNFLEVGTIISAIKINLFEFLTIEPLTSKEIHIGLKLKCKVRNFEDFLDKLTATGYIIRQEFEMEEPQYKCKSNIFLRDNPHNLVPYYLMIDRFLKRLTRFDELLTEGEIKHFEDTFQVIYSNPEDLWAFLNSMALMHATQFETIAKKLNFSKYQTVTDIGGALGLFSVKLKCEHPEILCRTFDLPKIEKYTQRFIEEKGFKGQIEVISGDMFQDDYPKSDMIVLANLTNDWNEERKKILFGRAFEGLNENGALLIVEEFIDKKKEKDDYGLNLSLYMFVECTDGFNISFEEVENYAKNAGFDEVENVSGTIETKGVLCHKKRKI